MTIINYLSSKLCIEIPCCAGAILKYKLLHSYNIVMSSLAHVPRVPVFCTFKSLDDLYLHWIMVMVMVVAVPYNAMGNDRQRNARGRSWR